MHKKSKILGMLVGGAIGDALGRPAESMTPEQFRENYPEGIRDYLAPRNNKWFKDDKKGVFTDDTNLTLAVFRSLSNGSIDLDRIAKEHVTALQESTEGWGPTTLDAVKRLEQGISWKESGITKDANRGAGNGVPMKVAPLAAWCYATRNDPLHLIDELIAFSAMTHYTRVSAVATVAHAKALYSCLWANVSWYNEYNNFLLPLLDAAEACEGHIEHLPDLTGYDLGKVINRIHSIDELTQKWSLDEIRKRFGKGNSNVTSSLFVSYAFFLKNPYSLESLFEVMAYGGDVDTNAKFVGELLGALNGIELFLNPKYKHLIDGLIGYNTITQLVDKFCMEYKLD